jgi:6-pyruvoyltetrahydropterin/6-carboxytetrahydropterin synthase
MRAYLSRRYHFVASHRLHTDALTDEANRATFGKCNNPYGHGHNYTVEVTFAGPVDPATGMVTNLGDLDEFARERLLERFDHTNLNTLALFTDLVPTTENLSVELHKIFAPYPYAQLTRIHVEETANNSFDFAGDALPSAGRY